MCVLLYALKALLRSTDILAGPCIRGGVENVLSNVALRVCVRDDLTEVQDDLAHWLREFTTVQ